MSSQTIQDAFAPIEQVNHEVVMKNTWGHLAPKKNKKYFGFIIFCYASDGTLCPIDYDFGNLPGSPWLYDAIIDFIDENAKEQGRIYKFIGTFCNYVFNGTVNQINT